MSNNAYIVSAVRTAGGKKNGSLSQWHPADLGAKVLDELVLQTGIDPALISLERIELVSRLANIHDFIVTDLPNGYDSLVGDRGVRLSGGQRQRIGIARALYNDPEVLIFDEATNALDGITESTVIDALNSLSGQKTIIVIAHRLTTIISCDIIYLLGKGTLLDKGTYKELIENNSRFKAMVKHS